MTHFKGVFTQSVSLARLTLRNTSSCERYPKIQKLKNVSHNSDMTGMCPS